MEIKVSGQRRFHGWHTVVQDKQLVNHLPEPDAWSRNGVSAEFRFVTLRMNGLYTIQVNFKRADVRALAVATLPSWELRALANLSRDQRMSFRGLSENEVAALLLQERQEQSKSPLTAEQKIALALEILGGLTFEHAIQLLAQAFSNASENVATAQPDSP